MVDRRDIELVLRATDQTSKQFADVKRAVEGLTGALGQQLQAAETGDVALNDLKDTLRKLEEAGRSLIQQQGLIDLYRNLGTQLEGAKGKAVEARAAFDALKASHEEGAKLTKDQRTALADMRREATSAEKDVGRLTDRIGRQAEKLREAGIATDELETQQAQLAAAAQQAGAGLNSARAAVDSYAGHIKALAAAERAQQEALAASLAPTRSILQQKAAAAKEAAIAAQAATKAQADAAVAAERAQQDALANSLAPTRSILAQKVAATKEAAEAMRLAAKEQADALALALAPARLVVQDRAAADAEAATLNKTLDGYRRLADQLGQTATRYSSLSDASLTLRERLDSVAASVRAINDPAAAQRQTLAGVEQQIQSIAAAADASKGPVKDYELTLGQIAAAQRSLANQAGAIDSFRQQTAVVREARTAFVAARTELRDVEQQLRGTGAANDELRARAAAATAAVAAASRELRNQFVRAAELRNELRGAGIDTSKLVTEQQRLVASATRASAAAAKLNAEFQKSGRSTEGGGIFGLSPYAVQNLGYQLNDVFVQISSGTSVLQTLSQQGPQILQAIPGAFGAIASRLPLVTAGVVALVAAFGTLKAALDEISQTRAFDAYLKASADGLGYQAEELARNQKELRQLGASSEDATAALRTFIDQGIRSDRLREFGRAAQDVADALGKKLPDAAKLLAEGFSGGWAQVLALNEQLNFLTAGSAERIRALFDEGKSVEANSEAFRLLKERIGPAAEAARGPFTTALRDASAALSDMFSLMARTPAVQTFIYSMQQAAGAVSYLSRAYRAAIDDSAEAGLARAEAAATLAEKTLERARAFVDRGGDPRAVAAAQRQADAARAELERLRAAAAAKPAPAPGLTNEDDNRQRIRDEEYLRRQQERFDAGDKAIAQDRVRRAGLEALRAAQEARLSPEAALQAQRAAEAETLKDIEKAEEAIIAKGRERLDAQRQQSREQQIAAAGAAAEREARTAGAREEIITQARANAELAKRRELEAGEAGRVEALRNRLQMTREQTAAERIQAAGEEAARKARDAGDTAEGIREQRRLAEELKRREVAREGASSGNDRLALERQLANDLQQLRSAASRSERGDVEAQTRAIDERFSRIFANVDRLRAMGADSVQGMALGEYRAQLEVQLDLLKNQATLKAFEDQITDLAKQRQETNRAISDQVAAGNITASAGYEQAKEASATIARQTREAARAGLEFAMALRGAEPNPKLDRFIERLRGAAGINQAGVQTDVDPAARRDAAARLRAQEAEIRDRFAERNLAGKAFDESAEKNVISPFEADRQTEQAFADTRENIASAVDELETMNNAMREAGDISATTFNRTNAEIGLMRANLEYISPLAANIEKAFGQAFAGAMSSGFDMVAQSVAGVIDGTQKWSDVMTVAGQAILTTLAEVLKAIAMAIIQFYALRIAKSIAGVAHGGGIAGSLTRTREVDPNWFIAAPRYHGGGIAGSLAPNEVPAILERGEEVLDTKNPRHILNAGRQAPGSGGGGSLAIRNVLVVDPSMITEAMSSSQGERVTVASIKRNAGAIKSILGVR